LEELSLLKFERFVQGSDELKWVRIWNEVYGKRWDNVPMTVRQFRTLEKHPDFEAEEMFIAMLDGKPVGTVRAHVHREEKKGFVVWFAVRPKFRGQGIEQKMAQKALEELEKKGMKTVQTSVDSNEESLIRMWENLGFKLARKFSVMTADLATLPSGIGENSEVELKPLRKDSDEDLEMLNWLQNESFKEHFNHQPNPIEWTTYFVRKDPFFTIQEWVFAMLNGNHVGFVGTGIEESYNKARNAKVGWIMSIGVLKSYRQTGIGTKLISQGMNLLKRTGMTQARLAVDDWNVTKAIQLYEKVGFKVAREEIFYEKDLGTVWRARRKADRTIRYHVARAPTS
jgi:ribosomal protein S18 acetylase RimI-like enzyme